MRFGSLVCSFSTLTDHDFLSSESTASKLPHSSFVSVFVMLTVTELTAVSSSHFPAITNVLRITAFLGGYVISFFGGLISIVSPNATGPLHVVTPIATTKNTKQKAKFLKSFFIKPPKG